MASSLTLVALIGEVLDLNVKGMQKNHRLAKAVGDASMSQFLSRLECKCIAAGKTVVKVSLVCLQPDLQLVRICE